jgi:hypothetical protein
VFEREADALLFPDASGDAPARLATCPASGAPQARVDCLLDLRYAGDEVARSDARDLYDTFGVLAGLDSDHMFNGGYRGVLHLVPELPVKGERKHLDWVLASMRDFDAFFRALEPGEAHVRYRWHPIAFKFMRSVNARTPSAYAADWQIGYNLSGSLHRSEGAVRETLFHEIFHLNDGGDVAWSRATLSETFDRIVATCGTSIPCLAAYTPNDVIVRGGTYYSFQPGNGVREYAAELATRYYKEHRALQKAQRVGRPFKCGPPENGRAWRAMVDAFFGGIDRVPPCG